MDPESKTPDPNTVITNAGTETLPGTPSDAVVKDIIANPDKYVASSIAPIGLDHSVHGTALVNATAPGDGDVEVPEKPEPTFGHKLVGLSPDDTVMEHSVKLHFATAADAVNDTPSAGTGPHDFKQKALDAIKAACMWSLKHMCPKD